MDKVKAEVSSKFKHIKLSPIQKVPITQLKRNPMNGFFKEESSDYFSKLKEDILARGIIVPLVAKKDGTLLAGHNRWYVAKLLSIKEVPVQYIRQTLTESEERKFVIGDNLLRRQLKLEDRLSLYRVIYPDFEDRLMLSKDNPKSLTYKKVCTDLNLPISRVSSDLNLLKSELQKSINLKKYKDSINAAYVVAFKRTLTSLLKSFKLENKGTQAKCLETLPEYMSVFQDIDGFSISFINQFSSRITTAMSRGLSTPSEKIKKKMEKEHKALVAKNKSTTVQKGETK